MRRDYMQLKTTRYTFDSSHTVTNTSEETIDGIIRWTEMINGKPVTITRYPTLASNADETVYNELNQPSSVKFYGEVK
tara:strand:+ start:983 stop:1216 length:234 start_codon:yes stop_codon:yes gene_type:complete